MGTHLGDWLPQKLRKESYKKEALHKYFLKIPIIFCISRMTLIN